MRHERFIRRITLEAAAPLAIQSGEEDALNDTLLVRDPNGLPFIPATSLAGAMRAAAGTEADEWFGWQEGNAGSRSPLTISDALLHWSDDGPRDGLITEAAGLRRLEADELCRHLLPGAEPLVRQHVRLNDRGVVDGSGKFTRSAVPAGARFTFEVRSHRRDVIDGVTGLIKAGLWLGGATRSGYGQMMCIAIGELDLELPRDWRKWCEFAGKDLGTDGPVVRKAWSTSGSVAAWHLKGRIEGALLVGAEGRNLKEDRAPWREKRVRWNKRIGGAAEVIEAFVVPGSAIKGPLRHRALFHLRRHGVADPDSCVNTLFGSVAQDDTGSAGKLRFADAVIDDPVIFTQTHVGLDRFTGGSRRGVLFTDAVLWRPRLDVSIFATRDLDAIEHLGLAAALNDLRLGLCGIGAEWGEGAGVFAEIETFSIPDHPEIRGAA